MSKKILLFAPCAFNLAETTRMLEIAKGVAHHLATSKVFDIQFMSDGGDFEHLIVEEGFPLKKMEPRLTKEKIEYIGKVDKKDNFLLPPPRVPERYPQNIPASQQRAAQGAADFRVASAPAVIAHRYLDQACSLASGFDHHFCRPAKGHFLHVQVEQQSAAHGPKRAEICEG